MYISTGRVRIGGESFDHILVPAEYFEAHGSLRLVTESERERERERERVRERKTARQ